MTTLVTGAAGFIGSHVVDRLLADGHTVIGIDDLSTGSIDNLSAAFDHDAFRFVECGLGSPVVGQIVEDARPEVVMHLAAQSSVPASLTDPAGDALTNIVGTLRLLEACSGIKKFVYAASGGTLYGETDTPATEQQATRPTTPYGLSKATVIDYLGHYGALGLPWTALALANVYGERQRSGVVPAFIEMLTSSPTVTIHGDGEQTRDFVHVADVADAFVKAATRGSGVVNISTGVGTTLNKLHLLIASHIGVWVEPERTEQRAGDIRRSVVDPSRAKNELGWQPTIDLDEGIRRLVSAKVAV